jgi:hypothetical protein
MKKHFILAAVISAAALLGCHEAKADTNTFDQVTQDNLGTYNPLGGAWIYKGNAQGTFNNIFTFHTDQDLNLETSFGSTWGTLNFQSSVDGHTLTNNYGILHLTAGDHTVDVHGDSGLYGSGYNAKILVTPVPEPESWAMMLAGLGLFGFVARRKTK